MAKAGKTEGSGTEPEITPDYWDEACKHLGKRDRVMRKLIPRFGEGRLRSRGDAFTTLARSIVGQRSIPTTAGFTASQTSTYGVPATAT